MSIVRCLLLIYTILLWSFFDHIALIYDTWLPTEDKVSKKLKYSQGLFLSFPQSLSTDVSSVLTMTYSDTRPCGTLHYCLLLASLIPVLSPLSEPGSCGHEYICHLAAKLGKEYSLQVENEGDTPEEVAEKEKEEREREKWQENKKETEGDKAKAGTEQKEKIAVKVVIDALNKEL